MTGDDRRHRPVVAVLRSLGLGDFLTGVPALRAVANAFPDHDLVVVAPSVLEPLVRATGVVCSIVDAPREVPVPPPGEVDVAVNLHGKGPQSHRALLASRPGRLIAFQHPDVPESAGLPEWVAGEHEVLRWCRLLRECGIDADPGDLRIDPAAFPVMAADAGATVIHPGAASAARRWPVDRWAEVARRRADVGDRVAITASEAESGLALAVAERAGLDAEFVRVTPDLGALAGIVGRARLVLCGDTGVAHLATAFAVPSVVLFGPTSPMEWGPPPGGRHSALWKNTVGDPHGDVPDAGLLRISVDEVLVAADNVLAGSIA